MDVTFTLYKGFLIVTYSETDVKAYRNREFYARNIKSYETSSLAYISQIINDAGEEGDFTDEEYGKLMSDLGRARPDPGRSDEDLAAINRIARANRPELRELIETAHADSRLERNLYEQGHTTPLEFAKAKAAIWGKASYDIQNTE